MAILSALVAQWRSRLDDSETPYLYSNDELTGYANDAINELCVEIPVIEDSTTAAIVTHALAIGQSAITISPRVIAVKAARLASGAVPLRVMTVHELDSYANDWRNADDGTPLVFAFDATGDGTALIYPPTDAIDTLKLTVTRLPLADLVYATDASSEVGIPARFHHFLIDGVLWRAYSKQDTDTNDGKKMKMHYELWQSNKEKIARSLIKYRYSDKTVTPNLGFI